MATRRSPASWWAGEADYLAQGLMLSSVTLDVLLDWHGAIPALTKKLPYGNPSEVRCAFDSRSNGDGPRASRVCRRRGGRAGVYQPLGVLRDGCFAAAGRTPIDRDLGAQITEHRIWPTSDPNNTGATAVVTYKPAVSRFNRLKLLLKRVYLRAKLLKFRCLRGVLGLKIGCAALKCRILLRDEPKSLLEDRRRAMFVDQFFEKSKHWSRDP